MTDIHIPPEAREAATLDVFRAGFGRDPIPDDPVDADRLAFAHKYARAALTTQEKPWPEGFFKIERSIMDRCASEGCGQVPNMRLEVGGVWSVYCEPCARKIAALATQEDKP